MAHAENMRTRSCSESTALTLGLTSPRSLSQHTTVATENQEWPHYDDQICVGQGAQVCVDPKMVVPTTPFLHKYKTELCKNWEIEGTCQFGDQVK